MPDVTIALEEITTLAALESLAPDWAALWARDPQATPFQSPDWLIPWWRHVGAGDLMTLALHDAEGALIALAPLYRHVQPDGRRVLFPLGVATTDYLDAIVLPAARRGALPLLAAALARGANAFDACEWPQLPPGAALLEMPLPAGWAETCTPADSCPALPLPQGGGPLAQSVPCEMLESLARRRDPRGFADALAAFDDWLHSFLPAVRPDDLVIITADHGNDPTFTGTDHTREEVPLLVLHGAHKGRIGIRECFADVAATLARHFGLPPWPTGTAFPL